MCFRVARAHYVDTNFISEHAQPTFRSSKIPAKRMKATEHPVASHTTRPTTKSNSAPTTAKLRRRIAHSTAVVALTTKLIEATAVVLDFEPQQLVFSSSALLMSIWGTVLSGCWDSARVLQFWIRRFNIRVQTLQSQKPCQRWVLYL